MNKKQIPDSDPAPEPSHDDEMPSSNMRSLLSFLLFIHLFCTAIALTGVMTHSGLQSRLNQITAPYNRLFGFDLNQEFYYAPYHLMGGNLMGGNSLDDDHQIELEWEDSEGNVQIERLTENCWRGTCAFQRRQLMGKFISDMAFDEITNAIDPLTEGLARYLSKKQNVMRGQMRISQHQSMGMVAAETQNPSDPDWFEIRHEALFTLSDDGTILPFRKTDEGQTAPIE